MIWKLIIAPDRVYKREGTWLTWNCTDHDPGLISRTPYGSQALSWSLSVQTQEQPLNTIGYDQLLPIPTYPPPKKNQTNPKLLILEKFSLFTYIYLEIVSHAVIFSVIFPWSYVALLGIIFNPIWK